MTLKSNRLLGYQYILVLIIVIDKYNGNRFEQKINKQV